MQDAFLLRLQVLLSTIIKVKHNLIVKLPFSFLYLSFVKRILFILIFIIASQIASAQFFDKQQYWKKYRHELIGGVGLANYLGELGGGAGEGKPWLLDVEFSQFRPCYSLSYRFNIAHRSALRVGGFYGKVKGSDALSGDDTRSYRNLSFESKIIEGSFMYDFFIIRAKPGHVYNIKGVQGKRGFPVEVIAYGGAALFYFNPKADGTALLPLRTEGQGLEGGPAPYAPFSISFPAGVQLNYTYRMWLKFGIDINYRYTLTDYLDDASTKYYDNSKLAQEVGPLSAQFADRTSGANPSWSAAGAPRGNPKNNDHFFSFSAIVSYNFGNLVSKKTKRPTGKHSFKKKSRKAKF